jgi:hypothetical protein
LAGALAELHGLGESRALLTVVAGNVASIHVIEANGGRLDAADLDVKRGQGVRRYWIDLEAERQTPPNKRFEQTPPKRRSSSATRR